jgi:hypothetical protein
MTVAVLAGAPTPAVAQLARQTLTVDLGSGVVPGPLPFDEPFFLTSPAPRELLEVRLWQARESQLKREQCPSLRPPRRNTTTRTPPAGTTPAGGTTTTPGAKPPADTATAPGATTSGGTTTPPGGTTSGTTTAPGTTTSGGTNTAPGTTQTPTTRQGSVEEDPTLIYRELTSTWSRTGLDSLASFVLDAGPLEPNTDYTFCFHLIRDPSKEEAAEFAAEAGAALTRVVRDRVSKRFDARETLTAFQQALIDALPDADSIEIKDPNSIFHEVLRGETEAQRNARLDRIVQVVVPMRQEFITRRANWVNAENQAPKAQAALRALGSHPALPRLQAVSEAVGPAPADRAGFAAAGLLANSISRFDSADADRVVRGLHPMDGPVGEPVAPRDTTAWDPAALARYIANLDRSRDLLQDLRDLIVLLSGRPRLMSSAGVSAAQLEALEDRVAALLPELNVQLQFLHAVSTAQGSVDTRVENLAKSVREIDFARIALRSTTSDTYKARANSYISLDAGLLAAYGIRQIVPYFGANLYFRPVNKNAPLSLCREQQKEDPATNCWLRRFSLTFGITASGIKDEGRTEDLFSGYSALMGAGWRLTDYWRVTGGVLVLRSYRDDESRRPIINAAPAISTSLDIDVVGLLGKVGGALFKLP